MLIKVNNPYGINEDAYDMMYNYFADAIGDARDDYEDAILQSVAGEFGFKIEEKNV